MKRWQKVWREGIAPQLSTAGLEALKTALETDDVALIQDHTCLPPPLDIFAESHVDAACAIGYCGWKGDGMTTVRELNAMFTSVCLDADTLMNEPGAVSPFLSWFDETARVVVRRELLIEVNLVLEQRMAALT